MDKPAQTCLIRVPLRGRIFRLLSALFVAGTLVQGCGQKPAETPKPVISAAHPLPRPDLAIRQAELRRKRAADTRQANAAALAAGKTPASTNMRAYLGQVESALIARGKLRTDDGRSVGPLTPEQLTEAFVQTALHDEYSRENGRLVARVQPAALRRWEVPVNMQIEYGASISPAQRGRISNDIRGFAARLQKASGHPVAVTQSGGNFQILLLSEDERRASAPRIAALMPGIPASDVQALTNLAPQNYCTVFAYSRGNSSAYVRALAVIRSELPNRLMLSCIHEELAQGMGPANDSPTVRPSIFNDDEEFALLTYHDELLLRILYDPRLRPGMLEAEARPIVLQIARELLAGQSV